MCTDTHGIENHTNTAESIQERVSTSPTDALYTRTQALDGRTDAIMSAKRKELTYWPKDKIPRRGGWLGEPRECVYRVHTRVER